MDPRLQVVDMKAAMEEKDSTVATNTTAIDVPTTDVAPSPLAAMTGVAPLLPAVVVPQEAATVPPWCVLRAAATDLPSWIGPHVDATGLVPPTRSALPAMIHVLLCAEADAIPVPLPRSVVHRYVPRADVPLVRTMDCVDVDLLESMKATALPVRKLRMEERATGERRRRIRRMAL